MTKQSGATPSAKNTEEIHDPNTVSLEHQWQTTKSPQQLRGEIQFLWLARLVLIGAVGWAGFYAWWSLTKSADELNFIAENTDHDSYMMGSMILLGAEMAYYLYISASFRQCREWGMGVWALGVVILMINLKFSS